MTLFSDVPQIKYEGPSTMNELAYSVYDKDQVVLNRRMEEWLRIAVCYWHSFCWSGTDMFGAGTLPRPWQASRLTSEMAQAKLDAAFDFFTRLGTPYFTFHDLDAMASADRLRDHERNLRAIEERMAEKMAASGVKLLWGTANLFSHPRYAARAQRPARTRKSLHWPPPRFDFAWKPQSGLVERTMSFGADERDTKLADSARAQQGISGRDKKDQ